MKASLAVLAVAGVILPAAARGGNILFDTFNGTRLKPHWRQPPPQHWEYTVGGGQLTVTDLFHPGVPGQPNTAAIEAEFPVFKGDALVLTTLLGWAPSEGRVLTVRLWGPQGLAAAFGYDESGPAPLVFVERPGALPPPIRTAPAPGPGTHEFELVIEPDGVFLFVDGVRRLGWAKATGEIVSRVEVVFSGTEGLVFSPLEVGLVRIVPAPSGIVALIGAVAVVAPRRRRR